MRTDQVFQHPKLIVEVLSNSTQAFERGLKFTAYRRIVELQEYVLIDPQIRSVEVFRRNASQRFELHDQSHEPAMHLASVDLALPMSAVFDGLDEAPEKGADESPREALGAPDASAA